MKFNRAKMEYIFLYLKDFSLYKFITYTSINPTAAYIPFGGLTHSQKVVGLSCLTEVKWKHNQCETYGCLSMIPISS